MTLRKKLLPYFISFAVTVTAVAIQYSIIYGAKISVPGILYPSTFLIASYFGLGPAVLAILAGSILGDIFFYEPRFVLKVLVQDDAIRVGTYVFTSLLASMLVARGQKAQLEKIRVDADLKTLQERFAKSASAIDLGVWYSDLPSEHMTWNEEVKNHFWLDANDEITTDIFYQRIHPEDRERVRAAIANSVQNNVSFDEVFRTVNPSFPTQQKYIRSTGWTDYGADGVATRFDGISLDHTELHSISAERDESLERAKQAVRVRDEFLSISSHEMKTPLTPLKMQLEILSTHLAKGTLSTLPEERLKRMIHNSEKQVERLTALIEDLLDVSRISAGKLTLNFEELDVAEVVSEVIERYQPQLNAALCETRIHSPASLTARLDRIRFEQILINFLTNASKYAAGKPIDVYLKPGIESFVLEVKDQGMGISDEDQKRIFDRYERVLSSATYGGLGLGLFIVRQIVNAHGGTIQVISHPGEGSTFSVTLPNKSHTL